MATTKPKKIRALVGLRKLPEGMIKDLLAGSLKGLTENARVFPKLAVRLRRRFFREEDAMNLFQVKRLCTRNVSRA